MNKKKLYFHVQPGGHLQGKFTVPGDKSISHRSIMLGSIADGVTHVKGFLTGEDCLATLNAFREMGVSISDPNESEIVIQGVGIDGLCAPKQILNLGNSGTSIRLLTGLLAGQNFFSELTGDESLVRRPMARIVDPLREMGAQIEMHMNGCPPLKIFPAKKMQGIRYPMSIASAQVKSCLLLAGLYAEGETVVIEPEKSRDHTERMFKAFGVNIAINDKQISIEGKQRLTATTISVPADISSVAFFMVGAAIAPDSDIILENVCVNPTRAGVIEILKAMNANLELNNLRQMSGEPVADIRVRSSHLRGITIPAHLVPSAIDEFPAIFIAAASAQGETILHGAAELRVKETDRIQAMVNGLTILGINAEALPDGVRIQGGMMTGGAIDSCGDHRIAMAFAMAGLVARDEIVIKDCANVSTSFPNFALLARQAGLNLEQKEDSL